MLSDLTLQHLVLWVKSKRPATACWTRGVNTQGRRYNKTSCCAGNHLQPGEHCRERCDCNISPLSKAPFRFPAATGHPWRHRACGLPLQMSTGLQKELTQAEVAPAESLQARCSRADPYFLMDPYGPFHTNHLWQRVVVKLRLYLRYSALLSLSTGCWHRCLQRLTEISQSYALNSTTG